MSNEITDFGDGYLGDGIYSNPDLWDENDKWREREKNQYELKLLTLKNIDEGFLDLNSYKNSIFKFAIRKCFHQALRRYCKVFNVSKSFYEAILHDCILVDVITSSLKNIGVILSESSSIKLGKGLEVLIKNVSKDTPYEIVGKLQFLIHTEVSASKFKNFHLQLDKSFMSELLSFCRLYFMAVAIKKKSFSEFKADVILYQDNLNFQGHTIPIYIYQAEKKYNKGWSKRHNKSLLFYYPRDVRKFLKALISTDAINSEEIRDKLTIGFPLELCR